MRKRIHKKMLICCVMVLVSYGVQTDAKEVVIYRDSREGPIGFAVREISGALKEKGYDVTDKPLDEFSRGS